MKTVIHFLPTKNPVPAALVQAIFADAARGARVALMRSQCLKVPNKS